MSQYNYNNYTPEFTNSSVEQEETNIPTETETRRAVEEARLTEAQRRQDRLETGLYTTRSRALERIEKDPFSAIRSRANEVALAGGTLQNYNQLVREDSLYVERFRQSAKTRSDLWSQQVGLVTPSAVINPAVVNEFKQILSQNTPGYNLKTHSTTFLQGQLHGRVIKDNLRLVTPEMAEALQGMTAQQGSAQVSSHFSKFYSRPNVKNYTDLFTASNQGVRGVFFQFQNTDLVSNLMTAGKPFEILTQQIDSKAMENNENIRRNILAGNELFIAITNRPGEISSKPQKAYGITSEDSSFHPKIGYTPSKSGNTNSLAFIGTQNVTPALSKNKTIESLLVLHSGSNIQEERIAAFEIMSYTDNLLSGARQAQQQNRQYNINDVDLNKFKTSANLGASYLYVQEDIATRIYGVLDSAANKLNNEKDMVVMSMGEITSYGLTAKAQSDLLILARENRLVVSTDERRLNSVMNSNDANNIRLFTTLAQHGALRIANTNFLHDKSIAVFSGNSGDQGRLKFYSIGSANITARGLNQNEGAKNTEVILAFGSNDYQDPARSQVRSSEEILQSISGLDNNSSGFVRPGSFVQHYQAVSGGMFNLRDKGTLGIRGSQLFRKGYLSELPSIYIQEEKNRIKYIEKLASDIRRNNVSRDGTGAIEVVYRYNPDTRGDIRYTNGQLDPMAPVGIRVTVRSPEGIHKVSLDLTVSSEGNVIMSDLNKNLNGALYVNQTSENINLFTNGSQQENIDGNLVGVRNLNVRSGKSVKLNSFETALGFINTIQREFVHQSEFALADSSFNHLLSSDEQGVIKIAKKVIASQFGSVAPEYRNTISSNGRQPVNLKSILKHLRNRSDRTQVLTEVINFMNTNVVSDSRLFRPVDSDSRSQKLFNLFSEVFTALDKSDGQDYNYSAMANVIAERLAIELVKDTGEYNLTDFKKAVIMQHDYGRQEYMAAAKSQSRSLVSELSAPYLAAHESTYSAYQGQSRLPVYGETTNYYKLYKDNPIARIFAEGYLNPLPFGHSTKLGDPGSLWRALGSVSTDEKLSLPLIGGLRQLAIVDSDISSKAGVVHDYQLMSKTINSFRRISKEDIQREITTIAKLTGQSINSLNLNDVFAKDREDRDLDLLFSPFVGSEKLTQRIKNTVGTRPALDISDAYITEALSTITTDKSMFKTYGLTAPSQRKQSGRVNDSADSIINGDLKSTLPQEQYAKIPQIRSMLARSRTKRVEEITNQEIVALATRLSKSVKSLTTQDLQSYANQTNAAAEDITWNEIRTYFREEILNLNKVENGFIGNSKTRRVALSTGFNLFGDYNYANADFNQIFGQVHRVRLKVSADKVDDVTKAQYEVSRILGSQGIITTRSFVEIESVFDQATQRTVNKRVEHKAGYYIRNEEGKVEKVASYTSDGFLAFDNIYVNKNTPLGIRKEKYSFKMPAFSKRPEEGLAIVRGIPNLTSTSRGMDIFEFDVISIKNVNTSNRITSDGLGKGPLDFIRGDFFKKMDQVFLNNNTNLKAMLGSHTSDKTFALMTPANLKGFAFSSGMGLLTNNQSFNALKASSGLDVARSLSIMFLGHKDRDANGNTIYDVKQALAGSLDDAVLRDSVLRNKGGIDVSSRNYTGNNQIVNTMAMAASGLLALSDASGIELNSLRTLVTTALGNDPAALAARQQLKTRMENLFDHTRSNGYSFKETLADGSEITRYQINEHDGINRGAGLLANLMLFGQQVFQQGQNRQKLQDFSVNKLPLNMTKLYHGQVVEAEGYTSESYKNVINLIARSQGLKMIDLKSSMTNKERDEAIKENEFTMNSLEAMRSPIIYMPIEMSVSQSLVPTGMKDSAKYEYQGYIGLSGERLKAFREPVGVDSTVAKTTQHSYFMLMGALNNGNVLSINRGDLQRQVMFKLPFIVDNGAMPTNLNDGFGNNYDPSLNEIISNRSPAENALRQEQYRKYNPFFTSQDVGLMNIVSAYTKGAGGVDRALRQSIQDLVSPNSRNQLGGYDRMVGLRAQHGHKSSTEEDYVAGMISAEQALIKEIRARQLNPNHDKAQLKQLIGLRENLYTTKNIVVPNFSEQLITTGNDKGKYNVNLYGVSGNMPPELGVIMGTDIIARVAMVFGDHKSDVVQSQIEFVNTYTKVLPVLSKLRKGVRQFDEMEVSLLNDFRGAAAKSRLAMFSLIDTDQARQAFGDHESFKGAVGIPINSMELNPTELLIGNRYLRLAGDSATGGASAMPAIGKLIDSLTYRLTQNNSDQRAYNTLANLISSYTVRADVLMAGSQSLNGMTYAQKEQALSGVSTRVASEMQTYVQNLKTTAGSSQGLLEIYNAYNNLMGRDLLQSTADLPTQENNLLTRTEHKLLATAEAYSKVLDLDRQTILMSLVADRFDLKRYRNDLKQIDWRDANLTANRDLYKNTEQAYDAHRLVSLSFGIRQGRTGMPGGAAAITQENDNWEPTSLEKYERRIDEFRNILRGEDQGRADLYGDFIHDSSKFATAMVVPSMSRLVSNLGDYDGDSHRIIVARLDSQISQLQKNIETRGVLDTNIETLEQLRQNASTIEDITSKPITDTASDYNTKILTVTNQLSTKANDVSVAFKEAYQAIPGTEFDKPGLSWLNPVFDVDGNMIRPGVAPVLDVQGYVVPPNTQVPIATPDEADKVYNTAVNYFTAYVKNQLNKLNQLEQAYYEVTKSNNYTDLDRKINQLSKLEQEHLIKELYSRLGDSEKLGALNYLMSHGINTNPTNLTNPFAADTLTLLSYKHQHIEPIAINRSATGDRHIEDVTRVQNNNRIQQQINDFNKVGSTYSDGLPQMITNRILNNPDYQNQSAFLDRLEVDFNNLGLVSNVSDTLAITDSTVLSRYLNMRTGKLSTELSVGEISAVDSGDPNLTTAERIANYEAVLNSIKLGRVDSTTGTLSAEDVRYRDMARGSLLVIESSLTADQLNYYRKQVDLIETINNNALVNNSNSNIERVNLVDYVQAHQSYGTLAIDDTYVPSINELALRNVLLEQQQRAFIQLDSYVAESIDSNNPAGETAKETAERLLAIEANRLMGAKKDLMALTQRYINNNTPGVDNIYDLNQRIIGDLDTVREELVTQRDTLSEEEHELNLAISRLSARRNVLEARQTQDINEAIRVYTGLPSFVTDARGDYQDALGQDELFDMLRQKFSLDGTKNAAPYTAERVANTSLITAIADSALFNDSNTLLGNTIGEKIARLQNLDYQQDQGLIGQIKDSAINNPNMSPLVAQRIQQSLQDSTYTDNSGVIDDRLFTDEVRKVFGEIDPATVSNDATARGFIKRRIAETYGAETNFSMTLDMMGDMAKKAGGDLLNVLEYDSSIQSIGEAGSNLIGQAYNSLIPSLDQLTMQMPFIEETTGKQEIFRTFIDEANISTPDRIERQILAERLGVDWRTKEERTGSGALGLASVEEVNQIMNERGITDYSEGEAEYLRSQRKSIVTRYQETASFVQNFQQIARDALKPPGKDASILETFEVPMFRLPNDDGTDSSANLKDIFNWESDSINPVEQEAMRKAALSQYLRTQLGNNIGVLDTNTYFGSLNQSRTWTNTMTGFGALMLLSDYTKTKDGDDFYKKFIVDSDSMYGGNTEEFERWSNSRMQDLSNISTGDRSTIAQEFIKDRIVDMMRRTQVSFSVDSNAKRVDFLADRINNLYTEATAANDADVLTELAPFRETLDLYQQHRAGVSGDQLKELNTRFVEQIMYERLSLTQNESGAFNADTVDYLRTVSLDNMGASTTGDDFSLSDKMRVLSTMSINNRIEAMRRGKINNINEAMDLVQFNLNTVVDLLGQSGFTPDQIGDMTDDQKRMNLIVLGNINQMGNLDDTQKRLLTTMFSQGGIGANNEALNVLANESSAIATKRRLLEEASNIQANQADNLAGASNRAAQINNLLDEFIVGGIHSDILDTSRMQNVQTMTQAEIQDYTTTQRAILDEMIRDDQRIRVNSTPEVQMRANYAAETVGILASPLLFALAGNNDLKLDERVMTFGFDLFQGVTEVTNNRMSVTRQYLGEMQSQNTSFQRARIKMAIASEGFAAGIAQGVGQELMYRGLGQLSQEVINNTLGRYARGNPNIMSVGGSIGTELLSSVFAQGVTRAMFQSKASRNAAPAESSLTRMVGKFIQSIWQAAEEAQMEAVTAEYVILDSDHNVQMDFELDSNPGDAWFDDYSGVVISDSSGGAISSEFEDNYSDLYTGVGTQVF